MEGSRHHLLLQAIRVFPHVERSDFHHLYHDVVPCSSTHLLEHSMNVIMSQPPTASEIVRGVDIGTFCLSKWHKSLTELPNEPRLPRSCYACQMLIKETPVPSLH